MLRPSSFADSLDTWAEKLSEELASQEPTCVFLSMWITIVALFCTFNPLLLQPNSWHLRIYDDLCGRMGTYVFPHLLQPRITCRFRVLEVEGLSTKPIYPVLGDSRIPQQLQPTLPRHQPFSDAYGSCFERGQQSQRWSHAKSKLHLYFGKDIWWITDMMGSCHLLTQIIHMN